MPRASNTDSQLTFEEQDQIVHRLTLVTITIGHLFAGDDAKTALNKDLLPLLSRNHKRFSTCALALLVRAASRV